MIKTVIENGQEYYVFKPPFRIFPDLEDIYDDNKLDPENVKKASVQELIQKITKK